MSNQNNYEEYFKQIVGYENVKNELCKIADILHDTEKYRAHGVNTPRGLLLYGEPGVGKTTMAECLIQASKREVFVCKKSTSEELFIKNITDSFDRAKKTCPAIVYLDDLDKYSNEDEDHENSDAFVTIQTCIDSIKNVDVAVIATVNSLKSIPKSLLREGRFDRRIKIENPTVEDAAVIISHYLNNKRCAPNIDAMQIARMMGGSSCAALETIVNEAGIHSIYMGKDLIDLDDIIEASLETFFSAPRSEYSNQKSKILAYHEAGHVVAREVLSPNSIALVSTRIAKSRGEGITVVSKDREMRDALSDKAEIMACLAGKAAVDLLFGLPDVGANKDIHEAFAIAQCLVNYSCVAGFDKYVMDDYALIHSRQEKEIGITTILELCYQDTKRLLINNIDFVKDIGTALVEKETLLEADIAEIRGRHEIIAFHP